MVTRYHSQGIKRLLAAIAKKASPRPGGHPQLRPLSDFYTCVRRREARRSPSGHARCRLCQMRVSAVFFEEQRTKLIPELEAACEANWKLLKAASVLGRYRRRGQAVTPGEWEALKRTYMNRCAYCAQGDAPLTIDHVVPLSRGGSHTPDNIVPACAGCNSRKHNREILKGQQFKMDEKLYGGN